jgi:PAS domain S-box-containing protein
MAFSGSQRGNFHEFTIRNTCSPLFIEQIPFDARKARFYSQMRERVQAVSELAAVYLYEVSFPLNTDPSLFWSARGTKEITGYECDEVGVAQWLQLVHPDDVEIAQRHWEILLSGRPHIAEFRIRTKDGQIRWLRDHGYPIVAQSEEKAGHVCGAAQDITWRKRDEEEFHRQKEELEARNQELDAFAYSVAHDLKNPISSMMGFASLVQKYYDRMGDEAILEYLELIIDEGYHLKEMINSLLVLAGVSKMKDVELSMLDMPNIVSNVRRRLTTMIGETGAKIVTPTTWPTVCGYASWVEEVWMNYLSNAMKYGGSPPVIELGADDVADGVVRFWVRDNGNGLTPEEQQNVFTPFTRLNQVKVEGHGLGLSVVQRIVRRLGGVVGLQSEVGDGSTFSFTLPASK